MDQVICIYHFRRERAAWKNFEFPTFGNLYTIMDRVTEPDGSWLVLAELENKFCWHGGWWRKRFKPIVVLDVIAEDFVELRCGPR